MKHYILALLNLLTITLNANLYGQGRVDKDPILYNIWWTALTIDRDTAILRSIATDGNDLIKGYRVRFFKTNRLQKVLKLIKTTNGTQLTRFYFSSGKLIFISVERNNFKLTADTNDIAKAINSFNMEPDTLYNDEVPFIKQYSASYYFNNDKIHFAAVVTYSDNGLVKKVRHDNASDIGQGTGLFTEGKRYKIVR